MSKILKVPVVSVGDRVIYALQPKQYEAYKLLPFLRPPEESYPQNIGYGGAAGGGKSYFSRSVLAAVALYWPGSTSILFRRTEKEVKENHIIYFRTEFPEWLDDQHMYSYNGQDLVFSWYNGSRTLFGYLRNDADVFTYQGPQYDVMIFEESTHYTEFMIRWLIGNRLRSTAPGTRPFSLFPSNPGNRGHAFYKRLFIEKRYREDQGEEASNYAFVQAKLSDNYELMAADPGYAKRLNLLPEPWRSWQKDGDWTAGVGLAITQLDRKLHLVPKFPIPPHWPQFGAFDWGYEHPWSFGHYAISEDGKIYKIETISGWRMLPHEIAERISKHVDPHALRWIHAGHDTWAVRRALGENVPTVAETFNQYGMILTQANIDRVQGLQQVRLRLTPNEAGDPQLVFFDTEGNRRCLDTLESMVTDPHDPEDALKVDANEYGEGGDDAYDETRYGICSRPMAAPSLVRDEGVKAWAPETLAHEYEQTHRHRSDRRAASTPLEYDDPQFGDVL